MAKKLPSTIYVKFETPSNDEPYLVASPDMYGLTEPGEVIKIGTYQLVETTDAQMIVSTSKPVKAPASRRR